MSGNVRARRYRRKGRPNRAIGMALMALLAVEHNASAASFSPLEQYVNHDIATQAGLVDKAGTPTPKMPSICVEDDDTHTGVDGFIISFPVLIDRALSLDPAPGWPPQKLQVRRFSQNFQATNAGQTKSAIGMLFKTQEAQDVQDHPLKNFSAKAPAFSNQRDAARGALASIEQFLTDRVWPFNAERPGFDGNKTRNGQHFITIDPNGAHFSMTTFIEKTGAQGKKVSPARQLLEAIRDGRDYKIACTIFAASTAGIPKEIKTEQVPVGEESWTQILPGTRFGVTNASFSHLHLSGARDDLMLSSFGLKDGLGGGAAISVQPGTKSAANPSPPPSYSLIGAVGYTILKQECDYRVTYCTTASLTPLADVYYGPDKNLPKTVTLPPGTANVIDRIGVGAALATRINPSGRFQFLDNEQPIVFVEQFIPEFITDSHFGTKEAYAELRGDIAEMPYLPDCFGSNMWQMPAEKPDIKISCAAAGIMDFDHSFHSGQQSFRTYSNFFRMGGEIGLSASILNDRVSFGGWYRLVEDVSGNGATAHNFTGSLSFKLAGNGEGNNVNLTFQYTDGVEDITLFPLPTWSVNIKAGL